MEKKLPNKEELLEKIKKNRTALILIGFGVIALATILIGFLAFKEPVVPVCLLVVLEAIIAVLMHNAELWIHGALVIAELVVGILIGRTEMMILCIIIYIAAIAALRFQVMGKE